MTTEVFPWREAPPGDYGVIGDPIAHTKSPAMHAAAYRALGLDLTYRAIHVPVGEVPEALERLRGLGYRGVNVTVPHKEAALAWATATEGYAAEIGAVNTLDLRTGRGTNTDVWGFAYSLDEPIGPFVKPGYDTRVLLLGAGGTAATVLFWMAIRATVAIWNRNPERAERLRTDFAGRMEPLDPAGIVRMAERREEEPDTDVAEARYRELLARIEIALSPDVAGYDLIVNSTPSSLRGEDLGIDWSRAKPDAIAFDLAYGVDDAPFLKGARGAGLRTLDGRRMLAIQGAEAFMWWRVNRLDPATIASGRPRAYDDGRHTLHMDDIVRIMDEALG